MQVEELLYNADGTYNLEKLLGALKDSLAEVSSEMARLGADGDDAADTSEQLMQHMQQHETFLLGRPDPLPTPLSAIPSPHTPECHSLSPHP